MPAPPFPIVAIEAALAAGVSEFIICAGARNTALLVALASLEGQITLWSHFEERAAGFFALGRVRQSGAPVAVVTTSGTAVAELLPAMIEAHYQGLPLVAITADRPKCYRGSGAPQAIEQSNMFRDYTAFACDAENEPISLAAWSQTGPIHLNVCLEEPNAEQIRCLREYAKSIAILPRPESSHQTLAVPLSGRVDLIVCGDLLPLERESVAVMMASLSGPIYAEASSGLRDHPFLKNRMIVCGDATLRHLAPQSVIRFGGVPSCRFWRDLESHAGIEVTSVTRTGFSGLARPSQVNPASITGRHSATLEMATDALARDAALFSSLKQIMQRFPSSEPAILARLSSFIPANLLILTGNSLAVREWNLCAVRNAGHRVHSLRGANGIDGNLSAFLGLAVHEPEAWCITGDLTVLYDLASPWIMDQMPSGRRRFVVINNAGGKIFRRLPSLVNLTLREQALMENPHAISLQSWAHMWKMDYLCGGGEIFSDQRNLQSLNDHAVIELLPNAEQTECFWQAWAEAEREIWS